MVTDETPIRVIATNRRARHDYEILGELECGISLVGTEVKTLRGGKCSIAEAHGRVRGRELWLVGMHVPEFPQGNIHNHEVERDRKLLAHRREIRKWAKAVRERGMALVPLQVYFRGSRVKVLLALARGKRHRDKRQAQRDRDDRREIARALSRRR